MKIRKMAMRCSYTLILIFCFLLVSGQKSGKVIILHTNDMHSKIDNLGKLAYLADSLREIYPHVFLVSAGDNVTGNPVVDMISDKGYPMIDLMNHCGFDVSAIGNHEFDMGQVLFRERMKDAHFPFISCNIFTEKATIEKPLPYILLNAGDLGTIVFLSAVQINANGIPDTHPLRVAGITFTNGLDEMQKYTFLKDEYGILVGLTHLGLAEDTLLAKKMPQLDLIIGGHSHTLIDKPMIVNGVRITQAGSHMNYIGKATLEISDGKLVSITDEAIPVSSLKKSDKKTDRLIRKYNDVKEFRKVAGVASRAITGENELGSMMADAIRDYMKTDIAFQNRGGIRVPGLDSGNITLKDIYKLDPFGNRVVVFRMTPEQIIDLIRYGYDLQKTPDLQVSGMHYAIHTMNDRAMLKAEIFIDQSSPLKKDYLVGMNEYMAAAYQFSFLDRITISEETTAGMLIHFLEKKKAIDYSGTERIDLLKDGH